MTLIEYVRQMYARQQVVAEKLGSDISKNSKPVRVLNLSILVLIAVPIKALVDKGVLTDQELVVILNQARDAFYDDEPAEPYVPIGQPPPQSS